MISAKNFYHKAQDFLTGYKRLSPTLLVSSTGGLLLMHTALMYLTGWLYAKKYYEMHLIPFNAINIPREYFFVYGFSTLLKSHLTLFIITIFFLLGYYIVMKINKNLLPVFWISILLLSLLIFSISVEFRTKYIAKEAVSNNVSSDFKYFDRVKIFPKKSHLSQPMFRHIVEYGCGRLAFIDKSYIFVVRPFKGLQIEKLNMHVIPLSSLESFVILNSRQSCDEEGKFR